MTRKTNLAGLDCILTGGTDREGGGDGPLVLLMHGFGAPGDDLVGLWRVLDAPRGTRFLFPEAPLSVFDGQGRAWWPIDVSRYDRMFLEGRLDRLGSEEPEGLASARNRIEDLLGVCARELDAPFESITIGGFSQGSMLASEIVLSRDENPAGLVLLSTTMLAEPRWTERAKLHRGLRVLQSHGSQDPILPTVLAEKVRAMYTNAGADVRWVPFRGGHAIPDVVLEALGAFLLATPGVDTRG